jgi:hypothetical protein
MEKEKPGRKEVILAGLIKACDATKEEQSRYREIIDRSTAEASDAAKAKVSVEGWKAVLDMMQGCHYSPYHEDWKKHLGIEWDQTPNQKKLGQIRDIDIRGRTYFLNELVKHTQRVRSMAMFVERIGTLHGKWGGVFDYWAYRASLVIIQDEAKQMGMKERGKVLGRVINASDKIADIIFEDVWNDTRSASNG